MMAIDHSSTIANGHMWLNSLVPLSIGGSGGKVRGNRYSGLRIGSQTEQYNPFLQLRCNDYTGTYASWAINPSGYFEPDGYGGYLGPQGTGCDPDIQYRAGNLFHNAGDHIWSWATPEKYYYANPLFGNNDPDNAPVENSDGYFMDLTGCQILSEDGSCEESNTEFTTLLPERRAMAESMELLEAEYSARYTALDSGNTALLLAHLADSTYSNTTLVSELGASGLLSDTVLKALCVRHPFFNDNHFTQLVLANSPVSWPVWVDVRNIAFGKLKTELQDSIAGAQLTDTLRTMEVVRRELMATNSAHEKVVNLIMDLFLDADSIPAMIHFLTDSIGTKEYSKRAVGAALSIDTLTWARAILDSLDLTTANDSAFYTYYDLALNLAEDTLTWFNLDSAQLATMWTLAASKHEVAIHAEGVLALVLDTAFARIPEPLPPPPSERLAGPENVSSSNTAHSGVRVYPNPFTSDFMVAYQLGTTETEMVLEVFDPLGRRVKRTAIRAIGSGTTSIDLGECLGLYLLRVSANGRHIHSQRIVCVK